MIQDHFGIKTFLVGVLIVGSVFVVGTTMRTDIEALGMEQYLADNGLQGALRFFWFAFGFPLGLGVCTMGAVYQGRGTRREVFLFVLLILVVTGAALWVPAIFGRQLGGVFFGFGGTAIMFLFLSSIWWWGKYRARSRVSGRMAADLQAAGYLCFGIAAWNLCGVGGMPSFLLSPDTALLLGSHAFSVGQMKSVMALLVTGWLLTALGLCQAARGRERQSEENCK